MVEVTYIDRRKCKRVVPMNLLNAVTDAPAMCFGPELIDAYPEAKVILTLREVDEWYNSVMIVAYTPFYSPANHIVSILGALTRSPFRLNRPVWSLIWEGFYRDFPKNGKRVFQEHYNQVRSLVPKDPLLEFRVQEGWGPLCKFLNQPVPSTPFPMTNGKAELAERIKAYGKAEMRLLGIKLGCLAVVLVVLRWLLGGSDIHNPHAGFRMVRHESPGPDTWRR